MLHFIVDGYNLINKIPATNRLKLEDKRKHLIDVLADMKKKMSPRNKITVIFDGDDSIFSPGQTRHEIKVRFSRNEDADSLIKRTVSENKNPKVLVVVTDDNDIRSYVRREKVKLQSTEYFLRWVDKKNRSYSKRDSKVKPNDVYNINKELKDKWRKKYS